MKYCKYCDCDLPPSAFAKRSASPDGLSYKCRACDKAYRAKRGPEIYRRHRLGHYQKNAEQERRAALMYYRDNREYCIARHSDYMVKTAQQQKGYRDRNRSSIALRTLQYRLARDKRTPGWLSESDKAEIEAVYAERERLEAITGIALHVDHIVPLRGETVSGLHVPWNLQIIPAAANLSKGNRYGS